MAHARAYRRHKERLSLSLSTEATKYARGLQVETKAPSLSAVFEELIRDLQRRAELKQLEARTMAYYDSLSAEALAENTAWAEIGAAGLEAALENEDVFAETEQTLTPKR
jgi:hypothetical protein